MANFHVNYFNSLRTLIVWNISNAWILLDDIDVVNMLIFERVHWNNRIKSLTQSHIL
jgi:hypothetical protein